MARDCGGLLWQASVRKNATPISEATRPFSLKRSPVLAPPGEDMLTIIRVNNGSGGCTANYTQPRLRPITGVGSLDQELIDGADPVA